MGFYKIKTGVEKAQRKQAEHKKGSNNSLGRHQAFQDRRSLRRSELGRQMEDRVAGILAMKQKQGELVSFVKHAANSPEDRAGKDFTVSMSIGERVVTVSFGITISNKQVEYYVPLIRIPWNMADEKIWRAVRKLCQEQTNSL